mmetsp:Transcript_87393/g.250504  ORF Transcript_87393/g.250504 Transcript_87393/m.250504 type:complete len:212 (+) Transcript_87393:20-655(+)
MASWAAYWSPAKQTSNTQASSKTPAALGSLALQRLIACSRLCSSQSAMVFCCGGVPETSAGCRKSSSSTGMRAPMRATMASLESSAWSLLALPQLPSTDMPGVTFSVTRTLMWLAQRKISRWRPLAGNEKCTMWRSSFACAPSTSSPCESYDTVAPPQVASDGNCVRMGKLEQVIWPMSIGPTESTAQSMNCPPMAIWCVAAGPLVKGVAR